MTLGEGLDHRDEGFVTTSFVVAFGLTMVLLLAVANVLTVRYAEGVMQAAVEEGIRQGLAVGTAAACQTRAAAVVQAGLGMMADQVDAVACLVTADGAQAALTATFGGWLPLVPDWSTAVAASTHNLSAS